MTMKILLNLLFSSFWATRFSCGRLVHMSASEPIYALGQFEYMHHIICLVVVNIFRWLNIDWFLHYVVLQGEKVVSAFLFVVCISPIPVGSDCLLVKVNFTLHLVVFPIPTGPIIHFVTDFITSDVSLIFLSALTLCFSSKNIIIFWSFSKPDLSLNEKNIKNNNKWVSWTNPVDSIFLKNERSIFPAPTEINSYSTAISATLCPDLYCATRDLLLH